MEHYDVSYGIIDYNEFYSRLNRLVLNGKNSVSFYKEKPIGKTSCGFNIEHYRVGNGPVHIVYAAGEQGSEIIGVNFIITLMENIAKGNGVFRDFNPNMYTIDFFPCLNPEGYFTTTYALKSVLKNMSPEKQEKFSEMYNKACIKDDENVLAINKCIREAVKKSNPNVDKTAKYSYMFSRLYKGREIRFNDLYNFLSINVTVDNLEDLLLEELNKWGLSKSFAIDGKKWHYKLFKNLSLDCIPLIDDNHCMLKRNISDLYNNNGLVESLVCFNANSRGVNLGKNNQDEYNSIRYSIGFQGEVYGYGRDNDILISSPSSLGSPNYDMNKDLELELENEALVNYLSTLGDNNNLFMYFGGTGNSLYLFPYSVEDLSNMDDKTKEVIFYTNNKLTSTFVNELGDAREELLGINKPCMVSTYEKVNGVKDLIRKKFTTTMLLQLSLANGNPLSAFKSIKEYEANMIANMIACKKMMSSLLRIDRLNDFSEGFTL